MMLGLLFGAFVVLLVIGMPVAYAMAVSVVTCLIVDPALPGIVLSQKMFTSMDSFSLMAVPFFMLAGTLMEKSGITKILVNWAKSLVGHTTGGIGDAAIVSGVVMAGVSGSANADTSALASMLVPMMREEKYDDGYACALVASCGALGPIIPPSIMMVLYSGVTNIPINKLFLAGYIPGLLIAAGYMLVNYMYAKRNNINKTKFAGFKVLGQNTIYAAPALVMPCIIIFGIMLGVVTATEAGVLACTYSIIYGIIKRTLNVKVLKDCLMDAVHATVNCMIIVAFAGIFGTLATNYNMSKVILALTSAFVSHKVIIMLFISVVLFIAGMLIDSNAAMLMLIPVFSPLILQYNFDPIYFAMVCILTLDMGGMSPPVGLLMYIASSITDTPLSKTVKQIWKFLFVNYGVTILVIFVPVLVTLLPSLFG